MDAQQEIDARVSVLDATATQTPARAVLDEVLRWLNGALFDETTYRSRFTRLFVLQVSYAELKSIIYSLARGTWTIGSVEDQSDTSLEAIIERGEDSLRLTLEVTTDHPPRIGGLLFQSTEPAPRFVAPKDSSEAIDRLKRFGSLSLLVAAVDAGRCRPLLQVEAERSQALASDFKLWVLLAVLTKVQAGELQWTDSITIRDRLDALPSGITQDEPDGSRLTVRELAERMITISDNTAADHLIEHVGRAAVEQALIDSGHAHPEMDRPFLEAREMFILKFGADATLRSDYLAADEPGRRELLAGRVADAPLPDREATAAQIRSGPLLIDKLEWFGSPLDLCRVLLPLLADTETRRILAVQPGVPPAPGRWAYVGFKGGSESGVLSSAWAHETSNGASYVTAANLNNASAAIPEHEALPLMAAVRDFTPKF